MAETSWRPTAGPRFDIMAQQDPPRTRRPLRLASPALVADIGATNARFAVIRPDGTLVGMRVLALEDYPTIVEAIAAYLAEEHPRLRPARAALAIASPVTGDFVAMTNHPWSFSIDALRRHFAFERLSVINDFAANALAIPLLCEGDRRQVGPGRPAANAPIGVIGPGTGLGVSALIPCGPDATPLQGEGGHVTMPAADARESAVLALMRQRFDHVSAERVLSGPGLVNLYNTLCELAGRRAAPFTAAHITDPRIGQQDPQAQEATAMFCAMLGTVAGNLALTLGARGGVYIAGGIVPKLGAVFDRSRFRERFEAKGRFQPYLSAIPTYVIERPVPALLGAARLLEDP
jgi:glucokinase